MLRKNSECQAVTFRAIGLVRTGFTASEGTPIQPSRARGARGTVEIYEKHRAGLADLEGFERVWLIYWLHQFGDAELTVTPYLDTRQRGVFATRAPVRPNPIGISAVRLISVERGRLVVEDVDILDGTPLLDIKPYVSEFDAYPGARAGWFEHRAVETDVADNRFGRKSQ